MRRALAFAVLAGFSLLAADVAFAGDRPFDGPGRGGRGGGFAPGGNRGAPSRPSGVRSPVPPARSNPGFSPRSSSRFGGGPIYRSGGNRDDALPRGHRVSPGGQAPRVSSPVRSSGTRNPVRIGRGEGRNPDLGTRPAPRPADARTPRQPGRSTGFAPARGADRGSFLKDSDDARRPDPSGRPTPLRGRTSRTGFPARDLDRTRFPGAGRGSAGGTPGTTSPIHAPSGNTVVDRSAYRSAWRNGYRVGSRDGISVSASSAGSWNHGGRCGTSYHGWYDRSHSYLSFHFGSACGPYFGVSYYHPFRSWTLGVDLAFFYPQPVAWCYVPYGFYWDYAPTYVTRYQVVRETVPVYVYEKRTVVTVEEADAKGGDAGPAGDPADEGEVKVAEPKPAAGSPATEKFLREASELFKAKDYYEAAVKFRLAALSSPDLPGPLFALGQSLIALGHDEYAARVLRKAVIVDPRLLEETGDVAGVFESQEEFDRVVSTLEKRAAAAPADGDARFLLGLQWYFAGDPRCRDVFRLLNEARPEDQAVSLFRTACVLRFKAVDDLPPLPPR